MEAKNNEEKTQDTVNDTAVTNVTEKKRSVKGTVIVAIVAVLAVAGVAGAMNADRLANFIRKNTSSPKEYYQYVVKEKRNETLKGFDRTYNIIPTKGEDVFQKKTVARLEVGDALKPLLSSFGLNSMEIEGNSKVKDREVTAKAGIKVNDADALTFNVYMNYEAGNIYLQMPELSEKYIDFSGIQNQAGMNYAEAFSGNVNLPDAKTLDNIARNYTDIIFNDVSEVKKSTEKLEVEGVSQKCTKLEAKIDAKACYKIAEDAGKKLETDEDIKSIIEGIDSSMYEDFQDAVKSFNEEMSSLEEGDDDDFFMQTDAYVDNKGDMVGSVVTMESDGETISVKCFAPYDGKKFGYELSVEVNGVTYVTISGAGERKSGKIDATYHLSVDKSLNTNTQAVITDTKDMITLEVNDFDEKAWEDGILKGEFTLSSDKIAPVALYSLRWKFDGDKGNQSTEISVLSGKTAMITLSVTTSDDAEDPQVTAPGEDAEIFDFSYSTALEEYMSEADLEGFLSNLKDKCGVDLTNILGMVLPSNDGGTSLEDYDTSTGLDGFDASDLESYDSTDLSDILGE